MRLDDFALREFREIVGDRHALADAESLRAAEQTTFSTSQRLAAIVRPGSTAEVRACVELARRLKLKLYPVSGGRNWGLGSRVPPADGCILLELGRMNQILEFDEELAYLTLEPGVTFRQVYEFLSSRGSRLFINATGATPYASVVGNTLERGDGSGPYGDRANHVCALEVVLGSGEILHTGFDRFAATRLGPLHRWGVGPALDGLFSQSNFGIVTRLTVWLAPLPRSLHAVRFEIVDPARLAPTVDTIRKLRASGTLRSAAGLWNDYRVLSVRGQYPWELSAGRTPLSRADVAKIAGEWGGATWFGTFGLYAESAEQGTALRRDVERALSGSVDRLSFEERSGEPTSGAELFTEPEPALAFLQGIPHAGSVASVYWRKKLPLPKEPDPDRDRCGVLWLCPTLPLAGDHVLKAVRLVEELMLGAGFEPMIAMVAQSERTLYLVPLVLYDRDVPGEDERALNCHDLLIERLVADGYLPYRLGVQSMNALPAARDDFAAVLERIKQALDPDGVIAPGRYDFGRAKGKG